MHDAQHAEDAVHGDANLVTHRREKFALGAAGGKGALAGRAEFGFDDFAAGDLGGEALVELIGAVFGGAERIDEGGVFVAEADRALQGVELLARGEGHVAEIKNTYGGERAAPQIGVGKKRQHQRDDGSIKIGEIGREVRHEQSSGTGGETGQHEHGEELVNRLAAGKENPRADTPAESGEAADHGEAFGPKTDFHDGHGPPQKKPPHHQTQDVARHGDRHPNPDRAGGSGIEHRRPEDDRDECSKRRAVKRVIVSGAQELDANLQIEG